ncbi:NADP-dependent oxidoreductase [Arthrobacter pityocampae]|uniref:NADP-dependent oxidoreductase n=1 Tax=Arthrobacter pityocampae TaxID=547334 RepID=A0A2S5IW80_9MICC|nr:NADP-dependent oxidoreductase [Arthrobacter pityocampae]PPB48804.1 NADP-dependent oxidoreductase [Arthrobacter pityocampae]
MTVSTQIQLVRRPVGTPTPEDFATVTVDLPALDDGEVRVRNEYVSVDPYMRGRMNDSRSYVAPFGLNETMTGGAVGRVTESASATLPVGTAVLHGYGWRDVAQGPAAQFSPLPETDLPLSVFLGAAGMTGLTAYAGLKRVAGLKEGDVVFISGAAGAVGSIAGQVARKLGASRVIGSAGSAEKVALLKEKYGYDDAFNYKDAPVRRQLRDLTPDGIDVYFDNVGGDHLEAAIDRLNTGGRAALCGAISQYNDTERAPGPDNLGNLVTRSLNLEGFIVGRHQDLQAEFAERMTGWLADGSIVFDETVVDGIGNAVGAFLDMMNGANTGKMLVRA